MFSCEYCKIVKRSFFYRTHPVAASADVLFYIIFSKGVAEYTVVLHYIIVSFWNLKSLLFAFIRCTTRCHSCYHSLSFVVIRCHSLSLVVPLVVTRCTTRCHSLSFVVPLVVIGCRSLSFRCHLFYHSLSLFVTRCTTRLAFYKRLNSITWSWRTCSIMSQSNDFNDLMTFDLSLWKRLWICNTHTVSCEKCRIRVSKKSIIQINIT